MPPNPVLPQDSDRSALFEALAFWQAPLTTTQWIDVLAAATLRTERGSGFHNAEVRRLLDELAERGLASRDDRGRWSAQREAGWQRFRDIVLDEQRRDFWWNAWRTRHQFDKAWRLEMFDSATCAGAMRVVIHCGRSADSFNRLTRLMGPSSFALQALREALLAPFDADLLDRLDPAFASGLAANLLATLGGDADVGIVPLLDWLLARARRAPESLPEHLHYRLAEALLFREQFSAARDLLARLPTPESQALGAATAIAEGRYTEGNAAFEAALKALAAATGKRKNLLPPSIAWLHAMAMLAQPEPAAWVKARKFAAAEAGKREALPYTFWGLWQSAIDQRLGDSPIDASHFQLVRQPGNSSHALEQLLHLLLAAWLRIEPGPRSARERLQEHAAFLETRLRNAGLHWLARLARRAAAQLLGEAPGAEDAAMPFFIGAAQDRWREALASIVALGNGSAGKRDAGAVGDRLIWTVSVDAKSFRIASIEALEQKASTRGLGKAKPVTLATLNHRKDLPTHDAAVLRAVLREDFGNRPFLDIALAAAALVRHPHVAWAEEPQRFIEVVEALPALEVMTRGDQIGFRLVDPLLAPQSKVDDDSDLYDYVSPRLQQATDRARQTLLVPDGSDRARLVRTTPAQLRVAELVRSEERRVGKEC